MDTAPYDIVTVRNLARGCAAGAAIGDALGMPLEFGPRRPLDRLVRDMAPGRLPAGASPRPGAKRPQYYG